MQGTRDYIKFIKRGYSRVSQINAFHVRNGRLTSDQARSINRQYDGRKPPSLQLFLDYVGLSEAEFNELCSHMSIPPYDHDFLNEKEAEPVWDFDNWYREKC